MTESPNSSETPITKGQNEADLDLLSRDELVKKIAALKKENEDLKKESQIDPLTEVYNRRGLQAIGDKLHAYAQRKGEPYAVFVSDIDDFKKVNDTHGHAVGDTLLRTIASSLAEVTREEDSVGRIGGDEFAGFLLGYSDDDFVKMGERFNSIFRTKLSNNLPGEIDVSTFGVSFGFASWRGEKNFSEVIEKADKNMYMQKSKVKV
jgi:diguanylate cyclase (GGDEF)-like protein